MNVPVRLLEQNAAEMYVLLRAISKRHHIMEEQLGVAIAARIRRILRTIEEGSDADR